MLSKKITKGSLAVATTLSLLVACGPAPTTTDPTPTPSVSTGTSPSPTTPTETPSPSASAPTSTPTPVASPSATPDTSPSSSSSPSTEPTVVPTAAPTSDISVVESTTFNGKVYDDEGSPLNGVTVKVKSLSSSKSYEATTTTSGGTYAFNNAPSGIQLEITASKSGYTTRRRVEVLKSNKDGDPDANRYDFGTEDGVEGDSGEFGIGYNGLSDKPEVVSVTPGRNASGVDPATSFVVKFSEGMDTETVEDNFAVYTATTELLSVDQEDGSLGVLTGATDDGEAATFVGVEGTDSTDDDAEEALGGDGATLVYDESDFDTSWNTDDTEVTFTFADEFHLPTDTESANVPDYLVTFFGVDDGQLKDDSGVTRDEGDGGYFKLTDGNFEMWYDFSIDTDEEEPQVLGVEATDDEAGFDEITVEFSEPMMLNTRAGQILGLDEESPLNPDNYEVQVEDGTRLNFGTFVGGTARFDSDDDTNSTVLLRTPTQESSPQTVGANALDHNEPITGTVSFTDGTSAAGTFLAPRLSGISGASNTANAVASIDIDTAATETITFVYTDGTVESGVDMTNPTAETLVALDTALETLTTGGAAWTVNDTAGNNNSTLETGDFLNYTISSGATRNGGVNNGKQIAWVTLNGGIFAAGVLNTPAYVNITTEENSLLGGLNRVFTANSGGSGMITISEGTNDGVITPGEVLTYTMSSGATVDATNDSTANAMAVSQILISQTGAFASDSLNAPAEGLILYPGVSAGGSPSLFSAGDNVLVTVSRAVVDPAGNSVDSSNDEEEDTAN